MTHASRWNHQVARRSSLPYIAKVLSLVLNSDSKVIVRVDLGWDQLENDARGSASRMFHLFAGT